MKDDYKKDWITRKPEPSAGQRAAMNLSLMIKHRQAHCNLMGAESPTPLHTRRRSLAPPIGMGLVIGGILGLGGVLLGVLP